MPVNIHLNICKLSMQHLKLIVCPCVAWFLAVQGLATAALLFSLLSLLLIAGGVYLEFQRTATSTLLCISIVKNFFTGSDRYNVYIQYNTGYSDLVFPEIKFPIENRIYTVIYSGVEKLIYTIL